jgi:hypothetical protein
LYGAYSLGNIGQSQERCVKQDIKHCNTVDISCPTHTRIKAIREFGIEDSSKSSNCPERLSNSTSIKLNLKPKCDLARGLEKK